ncbi:hypothetical protein [Mucilaginibacter terrae]|uniref:Uncharacterized protein n=1 Tax=Mucilaginibacter terrae TaxID=1955052 RepID=A0ABU3GQ07_9SPHI|nr:hypothetical protein [Mucilaginibacter terrae]MDT3401847.1 hypothetical protein [Mucilaginibacter terrae]
MIINHNYEELKSVIEHYYSGDYELDDYKLINELLENKLFIDKAYYEADQLRQAIEQNFPNLHVKIERNRKFPSIAITIMLNCEQQPERAVAHYIKIKISLLCPYFTIYHEESIIANKDLHQLAHPVLVNLLSAADKTQDPDEVMVNFIYEAVLLMLSDYKFAKHTFLLNRKAGQFIPYTAPVGFYQLERKEYSLFDLLFDNEYCIRRRMGIGF